MITIKGKKIAVMLLAIVLLFGGIIILDTPAVSAASGVRIGQATSDENGNIRGGKAGDQTGNEVATAKWSYSSRDGNYNNWKYVIRAKDPGIASRLADCMKKACANDHIGYDQSYPDRCSAYDEAKAVSWQIDKIQNNCETTCAQIVSVCVNAVGIDVGRYWDSSQVVDDLRATGKFSILTSSEFTASSSMLEPGDILVSPSVHTAMVIESPNSPGSTFGVSFISSFKAGKDYQLTDSLYVRTGPGTIFPAKTVSQLTTGAKPYAYTWEGKARLRKGTVVTCLRSQGEWVCIPSGWIRGVNWTTSHLEEYKETASQNALYAKARGSSYTAAVPGETVGDKRLKIIVGENYFLAKELNVRTGPGLDYKILKRTALTKDAKKHAAKSSDARLKKGTEVTCLEVKGNWMRIPSGWICCKPGNINQD